jgi:hypothetical protein
MRDCPTVEGSSIPLIIHRIGAGDCLQRQACNYHKCHRCIFRGKPAAWVPTENGAARDHKAAATGERAVPSRTVDVPRPERRRRKPLTEPGKGAKAEARSDAKPAAKVPAASKERPRPAPSPS